MTDAFTQIVAREIANLIIQNGREINGLSLDNSTEGFQLSPQQVLEVMQGNSQWLTQFETELEQSFRRVADRSLDYWQRNTDTEIRESLTRSLSLITRRATRELFESFFDRERITTEETDRSRESSSRYKASRGQAQARLSKELGRGKRYT